MSRAVAATAGDRMPGASEPAVSREASSRRFDRIVGGLAMLEGVVVLAGWGLAS